MTELKEAAITFLVSRDKITFEVYDKSSCRTFLRIEMNPEQLCSALGRLAFTPVDSCWVGDLDRINKQMESKPLRFPLPKDTRWQDQKAVAQVEVFNHCPNGWTPDTWFDGQNSFRTVDHVIYAHTIIRRWE